MKPTAVPRGCTAPAVLWLLAGLGWLIGEAVTASAFPGYSYATNYISDLGVPDIAPFQGRSIDSPLSAVMNLTFIGHGVLFAAAGLLAARAFHSDARRVASAVAALSVAHGIGIVLVGSFHGSQASVDDGTIALHVIGAAVAIIAGNLVAIVAGAGTSKLGVPRMYRIVSIGLGVVGLMCLVMLTVDSSTTAFDILADGVWERASVYTVIAWEILTGATLLAGRRLRTRETAVA